MTRYVLILCLAASCTTQPVTPTRQSRRTIDTLYSRQTAVLLPQMDSLCAGIYDSLFHAAVDSILKVRRLDMKKLTE